jgi:MFS family permease
MLGNGGVNVAEIVLVREDLGAGDFGYGLLLAAGGVGLVAGSLYGGGLTERLGLRALYAGSIAVMAIGLGAAASRPKSGWPRAGSPWEPPGTGPRSSATRCSSSGAPRTASGAALSQFS